jgi:hypothetical protein
MILALLVAAGTRIFSCGNCTQKSKMMTRVAKQVIRRIPNKFGTTVLKTILSTASQFTDQRGKTSNRLFITSLKAKETGRYEETTNYN